MVGETVSHYRILEELGGGAMGVVYKAQDTRLKRLVALKFLPPGLTRDLDAKQRFVQEAEAASALDDPHVGTIYDIDQTDDGRVFIAMAFYDGETLKKHIQRGPLPVERVIAFATQIARGLAAAHDAGIVHRDIKPANLMITTRGEAKIVDFGIAKLTGADLTRTGSSLGTVAYMAPEQFHGVADARVDLWALGVVLHEMLTGRRPFEGRDDVTVMNAIVNDTPPPIPSIRADVPERLAAVVGRALQKEPGARYAAARDMVADLEAARPQPAAPDRIEAPSALRVLLRPLVALPLLVVIGLLGYIAVTTLMAQSRARRAREVTIPEITRLVGIDEYAKAYDLALQANRDIPNDPMLASLMAQMTALPTFTVTRPAAVRVSVKPYAAPQSEWRPVEGPTPAKALLPRGAYRWRLEADGFQTAEFARIVGDGGPGKPGTIELAQAGEIPDGMVPIPGSQGTVDLTGFMTEDQVGLPPFAIDRHEVTNRQFKEFIDAGGYTNRELWKHAMVGDGRALSWEQAMALFRDSSGRPGPSTWELGDFPTAQADHPVTGVSWYEAAAYAEFRRASLPTIYHWARAALAYTRPAPIRGLIIQASNFAGQGPVAVGSTGALGPFGAYDMAGNVREWCFNASGSNRWILGGAWNDHDYMSVMPYALPPLDRSAMNGFRLARYVDASQVSELSKPLEVFRQDYRAVKPVSDDIYEVFKRQLAYVPSPPDARVEATDASAPEWTRETVTIDTGYGERMTVYLFVPNSGPARHQAIVSFPGIGPFLNNTPTSRLPGQAMLANRDYVIKSGRIIVVPIWKGAGERFDGFITLTGDRYLQTFRQRMREWRQELGQLLDYLSTRPDVQPGGFAYWGNSFGSSTMLPLLATEPRFKAAVLLLAGFTYRDMLPEVGAVNFAPRITQPVLMLGGRYDHLFPVELSQEPLFNLLGTPAGQKRMVLFDAGHGGLPRGQVINESLAWLDRHLGPVQ